ncbi:MAG TPA: flagellar export chaperone FliS [Pirellulales bacterium]|jgi:flagellar protein FliS
MPINSRDHYLEHEVLSAAPQKLQLMLLEAAIRHARTAKLMWSQQRDEAAGDAIERAQQIIAQLLGGLHPEDKQPLVRRVAAIYSFVFRSLGTARMQRDEATLDAALRILEIERETWRQVCQQLGSTNEDARPANSHFASHSHHMHELQQGVSLEA